MKEKSMNELLIIGIVVVAVIALATVQLASPTGEMTLVQSDNEHSISVQGSSTITSDPDEVSFSVGVQTQASDAVDAQQENSDKMDAIKTALFAAGLSVDEIQSSSYSVSPDYDWSGSARRITGYTASHTLQIKTSKINEVGKLLDAATNSGANNMGSIYFGLSDAKEEGLRKQALGQAVDVAKGKAQALASAAGVGLGQTIYITEGSSTSYQTNIAYAMDEAAPRAGGTSIEPGSVDLTASVTVTYAIG